MHGRASSDHARATWALAFSACTNGASVHTKGQGGSTEEHNKTEGDTAAGHQVGITHACAARGRGRAGEPQRVSNGMRRLLLSSCEASSSVVGSITTGRAHLLLLMPPFLEVPVRTGRQS